MREARKHPGFRAVVGLLVALGVAPLPPGAWAANHREAPLTALDHKADITDFFAFRSYDPASADRVTFILSVDPLLEPANGPNYFPFDPDLLYEIKIDNDNDAVEDVTFQFRFQTEIRLPGVFTGFVGAGAGVPAPANSPAPVPPGTTIVPPAITTLDGPGSQGLSLRQHYTVTMVRGHGPGARRTSLSAPRRLFAVPSNVGPRTMPSYAAPGGLFEQGIHDLGSGIRVFAGTVDDAFWIDLGAAFDSLAFRPGAFLTGVPGVLSDAQDADDTRSFAADDVAGYNVNAIAIEVPVTLLTRTGAVEPATSAAATIGAWGATSRPRVKVLPAQPGGRTITTGGFVQIQRMGNPLFNELIIGTGSKDRFSMSHPKDDAQFAGFALDPVLARVLNAVYEAGFGPGVLPVPPPPRTDLLPLVQYLPPIAAPGTPTGPVADLLRLNTGVPPTPLASQKRLGLLAHDVAGAPTPDPAGFPNGRRVTDDVTDVAARAVAGVLGSNACCTGFPHNRIGDGVNVNDRPYRATFPYLAPAHSGRDSRHVDPGEPGCGAGLCP